MCKKFFDLGSDFKIIFSNFRKYRKWSKRYVKRALCPCHLNPSFKCKKGLKRQFKESLIPFSLAHTAHKNSGWKNCFGRIFMQGVFPSVTTTLNPLNRQVFALIPLTLTRVSLGANYFSGKNRASNCKSSADGSRVGSGTSHSRQFQVLWQQHFCHFSGILFWQDSCDRDFDYIPFNFSDWQCGSSSIELPLGTTAHSGAADESVRRLTCFSSNFHGFHQVTTF